MLPSPNSLPFGRRDSSEILFSRGDEPPDAPLPPGAERRNGASACLIRRVRSFRTTGPRTGSSSPTLPRSPITDTSILGSWRSAARRKERNARPFLQHSYQEFTAQFSPADAGESPRWLAYTSNETGRYEVYVRDFPDGRHKWQVSNQGGLQPHWRRDGRELFYLTLDGTLMSVSVNPGPDFEFGASQPLFRTGLRFLTRYHNLDESVCRITRRTAVSSEPLPSGDRTRCHHGRDSLVDRTLASP